MTTIAIDASQGAMGSDLMATSNEHEVRISCPKIRRFTGARFSGLMASAGSEGPALVAEDWLASDEEEAPEPLSLDDSDDFTTVILTDGAREIWVVDKWMRPYRIFENYYAAGSGGGFAWAVLLAGLPIERALEVAIEMDPGSGMGIEVQYVYGRT